MKKTVANKGLKTIAMIVLFMVVVLTTMFSSIAYFKYSESLTGVITTGGNISHIVCDSSGNAINNYYTFTNIEATGVYQTPFYIKQTAGVNSKLRVIVTVSFQDVNGNLIPTTFIGGNEKYSIVMDTTSTWVDEVVTDDTVRFSGAFWRFRDPTVPIETNDIIPVLTSINLNNYTVIAGKTMIVTLTSELLQHDNVGWEDV